MLWILRIVIAIIVLQTLRYKFSGHPESKKIFEEIKLFGMPEFIGRIGTGLLELAFGIMILIPRTSVIAAYGIVIMMTGAMYFHVRKLGFKGNRLPLALSGLVAMALSTWLILSL
jgi:putative oxidoreductase